MHDIRFIRENPAAFDAGLRKRNLAPLSAELLEIDKRRRAAISESESIQSEAQDAQPADRHRQAQGRAGRRADGRGRGARGVAEERRGPWRPSSMPS